MTLPVQRLIAALALTTVAAACDRSGAGSGGAASGAAGGATGASGGSLAAADAAFLDDLQHRTFDFFWETANPANGLVPDRWPTETFSSIAAVGFGLTAYGVGVERGWVTRAEARARVRATLRFLADAPTGPGTEGITGYRGFFYHFLDMDAGTRYRVTELSTIDTALLMAGVLFVGEYFDGADPAESEIRALADTLYRRVEWSYFQTDDRGLTMAWRPEPDRGFSGARWTGYDESMILHVLALGSPTHPAGAGIWDHYTSGYEWGEFHGFDQVAFAPLFGHQYSHIWIDFRGIRDAYMRDRGIDYFENSRRATLSQRAFAMDNPGDWRGFGPHGWGLTASDGPKDTTVVVSGVERRFHQYWARGASAVTVRNDGTIAPTAAGGSVPFAPDETLATLRSMRDAYGEHLYGRYGFRDAYNPTFAEAGVAPHRGEVVPEVGWFDVDYLGIDQGPIVLMIENHRTELIWETMRENPYIIRGLCRAGFAGGWLEGRCE